MNYESLGITVLWIFLYGYLIVASIDFGAGFFSFYSAVSGTKHLIQGMIERYLSPVWEVTNVFLIFFMVGMVGFFPDTAYYFGTALLLPGSIAIILLAIRGAYYAFGTYGARDNIWFKFLYGATGLLIPASLSIVLTLSEGGFIVEQGGRVALLYGKLFASPYAWTVVLLAIVSVLYISAAFLTYYADKARDAAALKIVRGYALAWSLPTIFSSLLVFFAIHSHNPQHFNNMVRYAPLFVISFLCFLVAVYLIWRKHHYGIAFLFVMLQFATAFFGYGTAHFPYVLYPFITLHEHFTSSSMAAALIGAFIAGLLLLVPSLILLLRLFLFDAAYVQGMRKK